MSGTSRFPMPLATQLEDASAAGISYHLSGALVPVLAVDLAPGQAVYFEHHILLWKDASVTFRVRPVISGLFKRMIAGMEIVMVEAVGPGRIAFSRDSVGQVFPVVLGPGQELHVREHQFLAASSGVDVTWDRVPGVANVLFGGTGFVIDRFTAGPEGGVLWLHGHGNVFEQQLQPGEMLDVEPHGWVCKDSFLGMETVFSGLTAGFLGGMNLALNRFTGPGRIALQSMSVGIEGSAAEGTAQAQNQTPPTPEQSAWNIVGGIASGLFGKE